MKTIKNKSDLPLSFLAGVIGGSLCGIILLFANQVIWLNSTSGGVWDWGFLGLGILYGSFFGILMAPLGYIIFLRQIGVRKAVLPASMGTIFGGSIGAYFNLVAALIFGCLGFFLCLFGLWLTMRRNTA